MTNRLEKSFVFEMPYDADQKRLVIDDLIKTGKPNEEFFTVCAGKFWGTEKFFIEEFAPNYPNGIMGHGVGFMSPLSNAPPNPTFDEVMEGDTTYLHVIHIRFDNSIISYEDLIRFFFTFHDPTTA